MTCEYVQNLNLKSRVRFYSANKCLRNVVISPLTKVDFKCLIHPLLPLGLLSMWLNHDLSIDNHLCQCNLTQILGVKPSREEV